MFGGIAPEQVRVHVVWYHSHHDANVPLRAAQRVVDRLPSVELRLWKGGHLETFHREEKLPIDLTVPDPRGPFASLLSSFFETSFHVEHLEFGNCLVSARIVLGASKGAPDRAGVRQSQALALKHLAASQRLPMTGGQATELIRTRRDPRDALLVWTCIWELDRRARNKGKGPVAHRIWRSIPPETRRTLTTDRVWSARQQLLDAARDYLNDAASK